MFFELFNDLLQTRVLLTEFYPSMNVAAKEHRGERIPGLALTMDVKRRRQETNDAKRCMAMLLWAVVRARAGARG